MSQKTTSAAATAQKVVIERTYRARPEELWQLWTTREGFESWWGPEGFRVEVHSIEARLGMTRMSTLGFTSQLGKLDRRFARADG